MSITRSTIRQRALAGSAIAAMSILFTSFAHLPAMAQTGAGSLIMLTDDVDAPDTQISASAIHPDVMQTVKKVEAGANFEIAVDNGWVIYEGVANRPTLDFFNAGGAMLGSLKLVTPGAGASGGNLYEAGGIVFAQCPAGATNRCTTSEGGLIGVGLGFGQVNNGASAGGWVNDDDIVEHRTNPDFAPGSINAAAVDPTNGAFAVGWDDDATGFARAIAMTLDSAGQTYAPVAQTDLGTLGGSTSQAFGISQGAAYIAGLATTSANKVHAVYAPTAAIGAGCGTISAGAVSSCWIDLSAAIAAAAAPNKVIKSRALVANDAGYIAGSYVIDETLYGGTPGARKNTQVDVGFVYNINTSTITTFGAPNASVEPLAVLNDGTVVGNLLTVLPKGVTGLPLNHPFVEQGGVVNDLGLMMNAATGQPNYSCRVDIPNHLGELVGACIPTSTAPYGTGTAFYINALASTPAYLDLNADLHAVNDGSEPQYKTYAYTIASSIDDEHEITVLGIYYENNGNVVRAGFLAQPGSY